MYSALAIAAYVINRSIYIGSPVSPLKLQKILFYIQVFHYAQFQRDAFIDDIEAWDHGPVVKNVYTKYQKYGGLNITSCEEEDNLFENALEVKTLIDYLIEHLGKYPAWTLVKMTHEEGTPWKKHYEPNNWKVIPPEDIHAYADSIRQEAREEVN
jgi:uncharacterized phage-associated protein